MPVAAIAFIVYRSTQTISVTSTVCKISMSLNVGLIGRGDRPFSNVLARLLSQGIHVLIVKAYCRALQNYSTINAGNATAATFS
jgi:hypothetical protein